MSEQPRNAEFYQEEAMDYDSIQRRLAEIAAEEADLRAERKRLEHELAGLKASRPFTGPVTDSDGTRLDTNIEGVTGMAKGGGNSIDD